MNIACPKCNSREVFLSKPKHSLELILRAIHIYTYRCHHCAKRFKFFTSKRDLKALRESTLQRMAVRQFAPRASM